ncbi:related to coatomer epsilon subunit [Melanopsichium pennsylvanicum]|uniref:Coatomer subunit epsilon n=2 Tax=Melanopsichium pennsylvanicum TaxID=63383 RepID=A0AAJ5C3L8_9BASI|nr:related to coatomer epsilon subunit [Melanopsichium pennsylvanicum 4]SNX82740.1 related to coatomer epsilon subunit [Melanopsichium pennsylvanicum]
MESTLYQVQSLFYQGAYQGAIDLALSTTSNARSSDPSLISTLLYAARSHLARSPSDPASALSLLSSLPSQPHVQAIQSLAKFIQAQLQSNSDIQSAEIVNLTELLDHAVVGEPKGEVIRCAAATALYLDGDAEEALNTLSVTGSGGSKEIECVALGVHILLSIHRLDLAENEYLAARAWADDSLLIQLIEAWIGLAKGGRSTQQAFYVFDELAQNPSASGTVNAIPNIIGKATALAANGDWTAANKQLDEALRLDGGNAHILANKAVVAARIDGSQASETYLQQLKQINATHPLIVEYEALQKAFAEHSSHFSLGATAEA